MTPATTQQKKFKPTNLPVRKVTAGGVTGAFVTLIVLILNTYVPFFENKPISGEMAGAATTVLTFLVSYLVPPGQEETVTVEDSVTRSARSES